MEVADVLAADRPDLEPNDHVERVVVFSVDDFALQQQYGNLRHERASFGSEARAGLAGRPAVDVVRLGGLPCTIPATLSEDDSC